MDLFNDEVKNTAVKKAAKKGKDWSQVEADDDDGGDEGGGGPAKGIQGFFKREKLYSLIDKGVFKAETFSKFLNKDGQSKSELEKSALAKGVESAETATHAKDSTEAKLSDKDSNAAIISEETARASETNSDVVRTEKGAEANRQAIMGNKVAGSVAGQSSGNPHGFLQQTAAIAGDVGATMQNAGMSSQGVLGGKQTGVNFAATGDHMGAVRQSWMTGDRKEVSFLGEGNKNSNKANAANKANQNANTQVNKGTEARSEAKHEGRSTNSPGRRVGA